MTPKPNREYFVNRRLTETELRQYQDEGYLFLGRTLTETGLKLVRQQSMAAWETVKNDFDPSQTWLVNSLLPNIHHHAEIVRKFYFSGPMLFHPHGAKKFIKKYFQKVDGEAKDKIMTLSAMNLKLQRYRHVPLEKIYSLSN